MLVGGHGDYVEAELLPTLLCLGKVLFVRDALAAWRLYADDK